MAKLADVAELIMGQSPPSATYNEDEDGLPFFQGKIDFGFRHPIQRLFCNGPLKVAIPGDILISVRAPVGPTNIADQECCIGRGLGAIRPRYIDGDFLFYTLRHIEKSITSLGSGSTFQAINKNQLSSVEVNPNEFDLPEQRKIAGVLGIVQRAIQQQERLIALTTELKKALMQKLFTEGLRGEPQKQPEIGLVPESWEIIKLGSVVNFQTGKLNSNAAKDNFWIDHYAFDTEAILLSGNNAQGIYSVKYYNGKFNAYQQTYVITFGEKIQVLEKKREHLTQKKATLSDLFNILLHQLMTAQLRVHDLDLNFLECGDTSPLSYTGTCPSDQSADVSAHSTKNRAVMHATQKEAECQPSEETTIVPAAAGKRTRNAVWLNPRWSPSRNSTTNGCRRPIGRDRPWDTAGNRLRRHRSHLPHHPVHPFS